MILSYYCYLFLSVCLSVCLPLALCLMGAGPGISMFGGSSPCVSFCSVALPLKVLELMMGLCSSTRSGKHLSGPATM